MKSMQAASIKQGTGLDVRVLCRNVVERFVPDDHAVAERVRLGDGGDVLGAVPSAGGLECVADDALAAPSGEDGGLDAELVRGVGIHEPTDVGILALGVFADHEDVYVAGLVALDGTVYALVQDTWPLANVLVKGASDREQKTTERDVVLDVGVADGTEEDGVGLGECVEGVGRHHKAVLDVVPTSPGMLDPLPVDAVLSADGVQDLDALFDDLDSYSVSLDDRDVVA